MINNFMNYDNGNWSFLLTLIFSKTNSLVCVSNAYEFIIALYLFYMFGHAHRGNRAAKGSF